MLRPYTQIRTGGSPCSRYAPRSLFCDYMVLFLVPYFKIRKVHKGVSV